MLMKIVSKFPSQLQAILSKFWGKVDFRHILQNVHIFSFLLTIIQ